MDSEEITGNVLTLEITDKLIELGFDAFDIKLGQESTTFDLPAPQTVLQLRTLANRLHFKYLKDQSGTAVGTIYVLAESKEHRPLGVVTDDRGKKIVNASQFVDAAIKDLPTNRQPHDPFWNEKDFGKIILDGAIQKAMREEYGGQAFIVKQPQERVKHERIPDPEKLEQIYRRVREFHRLRKKDMSVRNAQQRTHCDPRTYYTYCETATGQKPVLPNSR